MSVAEEKEKIEKIVNTLVHAYRHKGRFSGIEECVVSYNDIREYRALCKGDESKIFEMVQSRIWQFGNRLYWSNQMAMLITYPDLPRNLVDISDKCADGNSMPMSFKEMYNALQMIRYNCTSNGGTETMTKADDTAVTEIMLCCANHFCRGV